MSGFFVLLVSIFVILGWIFDVKVLRSVNPEWVAMAFNSAIAFGLAGISLILITTNTRAGLRRIAIVFALLVSLLGLLVLIQHIFGVDLHIDQLLFRPPDVVSGIGPRGRPAPAAALAFSLFGLAFVLAQSRRHFVVFQIVTWLILGIGWFGCSPYFYRGAPLHPFAQIAVNSGVCLTLLATGLLCLRPERGLIALLRSDTGGGVMARRLVPAALLSPVVLAWLRATAETAGWFEQDAGRSLLALANVIVFGGLTWVSAARLRKSDLKNQQSHALLTEWQQRLESALENGGIGTWVYDIRSNQAWLDESLTRLLGRSREDLDGGRREIFFSFVHPDDMLTAQTKFQSATLGLGEYNVEYRYVRPDGSIIWLNTRGRLERDKNGQPSRMIGACVDITHQKQTAETLRLQSILFDQSSEGLIVWEWEQGIISWNRGAEDLYGFSKNEALGRATHELLRTEVEGGLDSLLDELKRNSAWQGEFVHTTREGKRLSIETRMFLFREGERAFVLEANRDVTERKLATHRLQTQLSRVELLSRITRGIAERHDLRSLFQVVIRRLEDDLPVDFCCVCLSDPVTKTLTVSNIGVKNQSITSELNLSEQSSFSLAENGLHSCLEGKLVYESDLTEATVGFAQCLAASGMKSLVAAPLEVESKVFAVLIAARQEESSFSSSDCEFLKQLTEHVALAAQQMQIHTALQQAYEDIRQTQQAVVEQERLRALGQMASGIAHDINNALSPVALYTDLLLDSSSSLDGRDRGYLEIIDRAVDDVTATVARMREFYRHREPQMELARVNLNVMAQQVVDLTRARWYDMPLHRGIVISMRTQLSESLPDIMGAESEIREALTNLVFNAVDAMPGGGVLILRTHLREDFDSIHNQPIHHVVIDIKDTGVGMDELTRQRCMEPFFTTKGERGTGLGLGMVYGVIQRHSASMEIDSEPGQGTTVRLVFSRAAEHMPHGIIITPAMLPSLRILVIDDDPLITQSLTDTLEAEGHKVVSASSGEAGIETLKASLKSDLKFDVVITDLGMPHLDGRQVAAGVKMALPATPVILLTGWGQRMVIEGDIPPHVDMVLSKPPKLRDLREALLQVTKLG
jgi:PAS domain S-box-containing protein